jgi:hypothetical protein
LRCIITPNLPELFMRQQSIGNQTVNLTNTARALTYGR